MATILIVDDERLVRDSLRCLLQSIGDHLVYAASTIHEAQDLAKSQPPDLLIVDWILGDSIDGLDLVGLIRESYSSVPAILISGFLSEDLQARIEWFDRIWFLPKPCEFSEFLQTVELALQSSFAENQPEPTSHE